MSSVKLHIISISVLVLGLLPQLSLAWVDLNTWKKPKVFGLSPSAETAQLSSSNQGNRGVGNLPVMTKNNASLLALYPIIDTLVAGFSTGISISELRNIPTPQELRSLKVDSVWFELAALYAINDDVSVYFSPGLSRKKAKSDLGDTVETFTQLVGYGVWAVNEQTGVGLGVSAKINERTETVIPLLGGAWQPVPEFRIDGWLPANIHARWKYSPGQALFSRLELAGDTALTEHLMPGEKLDLQLLGAQWLVGWSVGMPIGFGTGFVRIDPAVGIYKGQLTQTNTQTDASTKTQTALNPLVDVRVAVAF